MLSEKILKKIKEIEEEGFAIVVNDSNGRLAYYSPNIGNSMLSEKVFKQIMENEEIGIDVVATNSNGQLAYASQGLGGSEYCDQCSSFRLEPDPDPYDWFRSGDQKAVCLVVNGVIEGSLEKPDECINIRKPLYCPKLGRELSEDEKKEAAKGLEWARERMNR